MRAQQAPVAKIEGVVHRARRVVRREVQRLEVVPVVLDLRTIGQRIAQATEDVGDALQRAADGMDSTARGVATRQRDVDGFSGHTYGKDGCMQLGLACGKRLADGVAGTVDGFAGLLALIGW